VEERVAAATQELRDLLTEPQFGWRLDYKPTTNAGTFLILLNFDEDGTVRIQSDVPDEGGIYFDQTISYRIDQELETELVLETFAVFHYLFELNQNSFGGEFEFEFNQQQGGNLIFVSKSDATVLTFEPAGPSDADLISTEIVAQLPQGSYRTGSLAGLNPSPIYQMYIPGDDISFFASFDVSNRRALVYGASVGQTFDELLNATTTTQINQLTDIAFVSEEVLFEDPVSFSIDGNSYTITSFSGANFQMQDTSYCVGSTDSFVSLDANFSSIGTTQMQSGLFSSHSSFVDESSEFYSIVDFFVYDENNESIQEEVLEAFPNSQFFLLIIEGRPIGFDGTFTGLGWVGFDENNTVEFFLREMTITNNVGNQLEFELTDGTFITVADSLDERDALFALSDRVFEGGTIYASEILSADGLFELYNPCNEYKLFLNE